MNERVIVRIKEVRAMDPTVDIHLVVSSTGGPTGAGMAFYDHIRHILRQQLVTIGTGDIDSSGIIIFLTGKHRIISPRTTSLLHMAGRRFDPNVRYTASEMDAMAREDALKDQQYASVVSERCGTLSASDVLELMRKNTVLSSDELLHYGFAHALL